jgi:hypothetical protein
LIGRPGGLGGGRGSAPSGAEKIAQFGLLTKSTNAGLPLQSAYLAILNKQAQIMLKAAAELGFSPSSRSRVQVTADPKDGPFAALIHRYDDPFNPRLKPWELQAGSRMSSLEIKPESACGTMFIEGWSAGKSG